MQAKGRAITASSNKQYAIQAFFKNDNRLKCTECECLLDPYYRSLRIDFSSNFDLSITYEGVFIANKRFRDYIQSESYKNVVFYPVNEKNDFFYLQVLNNSVKVDVEKSEVIYKEKCNTCNYPREVIGGFEIFIEKEFLQDEFYTTDVYWRTHYNYRPRILIGIETYEKLKAQKFKGLDMVKKIF